MATSEPVIYLKKLAGKFEKVKGIRVFGVDAEGNPVEILVDDQGRLQTEVSIPKIDVELSTRASQTTVASILSQLDITTSALRDAIRGTNTKDFSTLETDIEAILAKLDVNLSTRSSETKLESVRALLDSLENALASVGTDELRVISP